MNPQGSNPGSRHQVPKDLLPESEFPEDVGHYSFFSELTLESKLPGQSEKIIDIQSLQDWFPSVEEEPYL